MKKLNKILNLTQYIMINCKMFEGIIEPFNKQEIIDLLIFDSIPSFVEIRSRADKLSNIVVQYGKKSALIGGAPYLMVELEKSLFNKGITPLYQCRVKGNHVGFVIGTSKNINNEDHLKNFNDDIIKAHEDLQSSRSDLDNAQDYLDEAQDDFNKAWLNLKNKLDAY